MSFSLLILVWVWCSSNDELYYLHEWFVSEYKPKERHLTDLVTFILQSQVLALTFDVNVVFLSFRAHWPKLCKEWLGFCLFRKLHWTVSTHRIFNGIGGNKTTRKCWCRCWWVCFEFLNKIQANWINFLFFRTKQWSRKRLGCWGKTVERRKWSSKGTSLS